MDLYLEVLSKYAVFSGRATRKEYWTFILYNMITIIVLSVIEIILSIPGFLTIIFNFVILVPSISVGFRRMHDTNRSGLWLFLPIVNFVFLILNSQPEDNRFGPIPKPYTQEQEMKVCPKCNTEYEHYASFCNNCNLDLT